MTMEEVQKIKSAKDFLTLYIVFIQLFAFIRERDMYSPTRNNYIDKGLHGRHSSRVRTFCDAPLQYRICNN